MSDGNREQGSGERDQLPDSSTASAANRLPPPLARAPLAYENPTFVNGAEGRIIRLVAEYIEPLARFRKEQIQDTVVFFGSARFRGREEADHALELLRSEERRVGKECSS